MGERHSGHTLVQAEFYVEEPWASEALFAAEQFPEAILDPACGTGNILVSARSVGLTIYGADLVDRGVAETGIDFLRFGARWNPASIVTNPPFSLAEQFIRRALEVATHKVAILARVGFLASRRRKVLFETTPLARILIFSDRIRLYPDGKYVGDGPSADHCWLVWDHSHIGPPTVGWLSRA